MKSLLYPLGMILLVFLLYAGCSQLTQQVDTRTDHAPIAKAEGIPIQYTSGDIVTNGYLDRAGNMWFTTTGEGIFRYQDGAFTQLTTVDGLCDNDVWAVVEDREGLFWFATSRGLCTYDGARFTHIPLPQDTPKLVSPRTGFPSRQTQTVLALIVDRQGNLWLGTDAAGAYKYDGERFTSFLMFEGRLQADSAYNNCIGSLLEDRNGNIWLGSITHGGINYYNGHEMIRFAEQEALHGDMITSSFEDQAGNLWFGSIQNLEGGLLRYDGAAFKLYTRADGLCDSNVTCFYEDQTGKLWIGTGNGICYFDGKTFTAFDNGGESFGDIRFITRDKDGSLWFGGRYGVLWRYDGAELVDFTHAKQAD